MTYRIFAQYDPSSMLKLFMCMKSITRKSQTIKVYIAAFISTVTKAAHMEIVSGFDTNFFINALQRFIARRRTVANIYSDNGMNFIQANKYNKLQEETNNIEKFLAKRSRL